MRHISDDRLADYAGDVLKPRKIAKIKSHLAVCIMCTGRLELLYSVPGLLASVSFPPIPANLSIRISLAIAAESSARVASEPSAEAGRRDLPQRTRPAGRGWRLPSITSPVVVRTLAAAGAAVIIAGGGYEIASHSGGSSGASSSSINGAATPPGQIHSGPTVSYKQGKHTHSIVVVESSTDFQPGTLRTQTVATLSAIGLNITHGLPNAAATTTAPLNQGTASSGTLGKSARPPAVSQLPGCVSRVSAGRRVIMVEVAKFQDKPATIIVVQSGNVQPAEVYAVGTGCSSGRSDILSHQQLELPRL